MCTDTLQHIASYLSLQDHHRFKSVCRYHVVNIETINLKKYEKVSKTIQWKITTAHYGGHFIYQDEGDDLAVSHYSTTLDTYLIVDNKVAIPKIEHFNGTCLIIQHGYLYHVYKIPNKHDIKPHQLLYHDKTVKYIF